MPWLTPLSLTFVPGEFAASTTDWLRYQDGEKTHIVPPNFHTDFGSVPGYVVLPCLVPRIGRVREAFVLHDWEYQKGEYSRAYVDRLLLASALDLLAAATDLAPGEYAIYKARMALAYSGVRMWGWIPWNKYRKAA